MHIELGEFGPFSVTWSRYPTTVFKAAVCYHRDEERRLETGWYENPHVLTPYVSWLHDQMGSWGESWFIDYMITKAPYKTTIYLPTYKDATYFLLCWGG